MSLIKEVMGVNENPHRQNTVIHRRMYSTVVDFTLFY